ncbi:MAG: hypothetical protein O3A00_19750 [Planctomycetota bacterium]|nr:hypothetical protein [Planctomycetota bacterium]
MAESSSPAKPFDPYHKWLGIPPSEQPPNHYRLLGLEPFEADLDVIDTAADRAMSFLQQCSTGDQIEASQKLLNEVSQARVRLLNAKHKRAYDEQLKKLLFKEIIEPDAERLPQFEVKQKSVASRIKNRRRSRQRNSGRFNIAAAGAALVLFGVVVWAMLPRDDASDESSNRKTTADKSGSAASADLARVDPRIAKSEAQPVRVRNPGKTNRQPNPRPKNPPRRPKNPPSVDPGPPPANVELNAGLVAYYTFEDGVGGRLADAGGQGFDGRGIGGGGFTGSPHGWGLSIGQSHEYHFRGAGDFEFNQPFSMSLWFYSKQNGLLLSRQQPPPGQRGYDLGVRDGEAFLSLVADPTTGDMAKAQATLDIDRFGWHLLSATYDGSGQSSGISLFLDGTRLKTTSTGKVTGSIRSEELVFKIGRNGQRPAASGIVDDVLLYNRVLSDEEIGYLAKHGQPKSQIAVEVAAKPDPPRNPPVAVVQPENAEELAALNRQVALWILERSGSIQIRKPGERRSTSVGNVAAVPNDAFDIATILFTRPVEILDAEFLQLANLSQLEKLTFMAPPTLTSSGLTHLSKSSSLRELTFLNVSLQDADLQAIGNSRSLTKLVLPSHEITDAGLEALGAIESLEFLRLTVGEKINGSAFETFSGRELETLELFNTNVNDAALSHIARFPKLKTLKLDGAPVTDVGVKKLQTLTRLVTLELGGTGITDDGASALSGLTELSTLGLKSTAVGDAGVRIVSQMPKLVYLYLDETKVTAASLPLLKGCPNLYGVTLSQLPIGDADLQHFEPLTKLTRLNLDGTQVSDAGIVQFSSHPALRYLSVKGTTVTAAGANQVEESANKLRPKPIRLNVTHGE